MGTAALVRIGLGFPSRFNGTSSTSSQEAQGAV